MKGKSIILFTMKIAFALFQVVLFILSIALSIISITVYIKLRKTLGFSIGSLALALFYSVLLNLFAICGFSAMPLSSRFTDFMYLALGLVLMNLQILLVSRLHLMVINAPGFAEKRWKIMNQTDIKYLEKALECCGLEGCNGKMGCKLAFMRMAEGIRIRTIQGVFLNFGLETLGILFLAVLRFNKKRRRN